MARFLDKLYPNCALNIFRIRNSGVDLQPAAGPADDGALRADEDAARPHRELPASAEEALQLLLRVAAAGSHGRAAEAEASSEYRWRRQGSISFWHLYFVTIGISFGSKRNSKQHSMQELLARLRPSICILHCPTTSNGKLEN